MKVITTGNPNYGLASSINSIIGGDFASRSSGYNLETDDGMEQFCSVAKQYDIIIINCYTEKMNNYSQARLLHKMYLECMINSTKDYHIVCIGSISDHINTEQPWIKYVSYGSEKVALKSLCQTLNHNRNNVSPNVKCTYISLGHMHTPYVDNLHPDEDKLDTDEVSKLIKWIIESKECIEEITFTRNKKNV